MKDALSSASSNVLDRMVNFLPNLLGAVIVLVVGWLLAVLLEKLLNRVLKLIGLQKLFELVKIEAIVKKAKFKIDTSEIIAAFVKWVILIITFLAAADVLGLHQVADFFAVILSYVPNVIAAVAILLIGAILAHFLADVVRGATEAGGLAYASFLSKLTSWAIWIFAVLAVLVQLGIAHDLIRTLFTSLVALIALAGGLAFGLGGQDAAKRLISKVEADLAKKEEPAQKETEEELEI
ncbi:MAG: small-conductance mechanosensitive ion channel [Candidatus Berkelbacteria bacterium Licking1014_96]|uniref:Small-conductance mechanosensitive ion channel n=1 Tax=Candidatus Berkelbacteria bacterium Licking1014_96 TaxID=2017149 RepID=A0A554LBR9_9BACT|nr:MAG: small-conductance mechanosensitive ion channel [Candidatus Berkelbacteria bacterium Licking1014_96]